MFNKQHMSAFLRDICFIDKHIYKLTYSFFFFNLYILKPVITLMMILYLLCERYCFHMY